MRSFASDNNSGVHPLVMEALIKATDTADSKTADMAWRYLDIMCVRAPA